MKRMVRKMMLLMLSLAAVLMLSACEAGSYVSTDMFLNEDLSGTRVFAVSVNPSTFRDYFNGEPANLYYLVEECCPPELSWSYSEDGVNWIYTFSLSFSSPEDYNAKASSLCGYSVSTNIAYSDDVWSNGYSVDESFHSGELLNWIKDPLVARGYISSDRLEYLFDAGYTHLIFGGAVNNTDIYIKWDNFQRPALAEIRQYTSVNDFDTIDRIYEFVFQNSSLTSLAQTQMADYFAEQVAAVGGQVNAYMDGDYTIISIKAQGLSDTQRVAFDEAIMGPETVSYSRTSYDTGELFLFRDGISETVDCTRFVSDSGVNWITYLKADSDVTVPELGDQSTYDYYDDSYGTSGYLNYSVMKSIAVKSAEVVIDENTEGVAVTTILHMDSNATAAECAAVAGRLQQSVDKDDDVDLSISASGSDITIAMTGATRDVISQLEKLLDAEKVTLKITTDDNLFALKHTTQYTYQASYENLLSNVAEDFNLTVTFVTGVDLEGADKTEQFQFKDLDITASFDTSKTNVTAYVIYGGILVGIIVIVLIVILLAKKAASKPKTPKQPKPAKEKKEKAPKEKKEKAPAVPTPAAVPQPTIPQPTVPQPTIPQPTIPQPTIPTPVVTPQPVAPAPHPAAPAPQPAAFCTSCGAKLNPGAAFCTSCGAKLNK